MPDERCPMCNDELALNQEMKLHVMGNRVRYLVVYGCGSLVFSSGRFRQSKTCEGIICGNAFKEMSREEQQRVRMSRLASMSSESRWTDFKEPRTRGSALPSQEELDQRRDERKRKKRDSKKGTRGSFELPF